MILVIGLVFAPLIARTVRAAALVEARKEYVQAAQLGARAPSTSWRSNCCPTCAAR